VAREANLGLDCSAADDGAPVVRIAVRYAEGYTKDGAPTLTRDCATLGALESAVALLVEDLNAAVEEAAGRLEGREPEKKPRTPKPTGDAVPTKRAHLDADLLVSDVMTRDVRTLKRNDEVSVADELMRVGQFRHAVVVDDDGGIAGILSQRDIMLNALSWHLGQGRRAHEALLTTVLAKDLMTTRVVTIEPGERISEAARRMAEAKIGCLPVVDASGALLGIVTETDFLALLVA